MKGVRTHDVFWTGKAPKWVPVNEDAVTSPTKPLEESATSPLVVDSNTLLGRPITYYRQQSMTLEEEDEAEDRRHSKGRSKEPSRLSPWVLMQRWLRRCKSIT